MGQAIFSSWCQPEGRKEEAEETGLDMVSSISFIQANLQQSIAASRVPTKTVSNRHGSNTRTVMAVLLAEIFQAILCFVRAE